MNIVLLHLSRNALSNASLCSPNIGSVTNITLGEKQRKHKTDEHKQIQ